MRRRQRTDPPPRGRLRVRRAAFEHAARPCAADEPWSLHATRERSTLLFAASACFFSLNAFSVRATFAAYALLALLALLRAPTLFARQQRLPAIVAYWLLSVSSAFLVSAFGDFYANFFVKFVLIQTYVALAFWLFASGVLAMRSLERTCETLIYVHAAFFIVQLGCYLAFGHFIDFDSYIREAIRKRSMRRRR